MRKLHAIERQAGRRRIVRWGPRSLDLTARLQVHHRRGTVLMVDGETFDDENPWHTCVRRELDHLEFPSTRTPVKARIRFSLR